jgi:hypothetical protein
MDEDDEKEEIFRKISNLITVRSNLFKIISTGQYILDKNNDGKVSEEEIMAEKRLMTIYDRNKRRVVFYKEITE